MPVGPFNPVISEAFTVAPDVVYSPSVPLNRLETNRVPPDTAIPTGESNPVMREEFTVAPEVVYALIVLLALLATKISSPRATAGVAQSTVVAAMAVSGRIRIDFRISMLPMVGGDWVSLTEPTLRQDLRRRRRRSIGAASPAAARHASTTDGGSGTLLMINGEKLSV
jgi:hypothetical protein